MANPPPPLIPLGYKVDPVSGNVVDASGAVDENLTVARGAANASTNVINGFTQDPRTGLYQKNTPEQQAAQDIQLQGADTSGYYASGGNLPPVITPATSSTPTDAAGLAAVPASLSGAASSVVNGATNLATNAIANVQSSVSNAVSNGIGSAVSALPSAVSSVVGGALNKFGFSLTGGASAGGASATINTYKVAVQGPGGVVIFEASSPVTEDRSATYQGFDITHLPTDIPAYKNTGSRKFSITGKLVSRNAAEATANAGYLDLIRSWILPDYGGTGATPPILKFYAYKNNNINGSQVILKQYSMTFPEDVDYIFTGSVPMPTITTLTLSLDEVYTPEQITAGAWKITPPTVKRPPDAFGNGDSSFHATGGSSIGGITLGSIIPVATALATVIKGGAGASAALTSLSGFALGTAGSLIGSNPAIQSFVQGAASTVSSVVKTAETTVQGALNSATASVTGFVNSIGSSKGGAVASNLAPMSFGSGDASSSTPQQSSSAFSFSVDSTNSTLG